MLRKDELKDETIETIYFGGGTPSILSNDELLLIIESVIKTLRSLKPLKSL